MAVKNCDWSDQIGCVGNKNNIAYGACPKTSPVRTKILLNSNIHYNFIHSFIYYVKQPQ